MVFLFYHIRGLLSIVHFLRTCSKNGGVIFEDSSNCRFNLSRVTFFHTLYYPEDKVMRWYNIAEKVVSYINDDTFLSEQVHIDEIAEEFADEMVDCS